MKENQGNSAIPAPPAGFVLDSNTTPEPPAGFVLDDYQDKRGISVDPTKPTGGGIGQALVEGAKQTGRLVGSAFDVVTGDKEEIRQDAAIRPDQTGDQFLFQEALQRRRDEYGDDGIWQAIKNVGGAVAEEPMGALHETVGQIPNSAAVLGSAAAGAKAGAVAGSAIAPGAGTAVGAIVGGIAGMFLGNAAIETGAIAQEQARTGEIDTGKALAQGATKAGVITGIDTATIGLNRLLLGAPGKAAGKAAQEAVEGILKKAGVDVADDMAVATALRLDQGLQRAVREGGQAAFVGALPSGLKKAALASGAMGLETVSEGTGEYLGSAAAGLDASLTDAVLESMLSVPQSVAETGLSAALAKRGQQPGFNLNVPTDPNAPWPGYDVQEGEFQPEMGGAGIQAEELSVEDIPAAAAPPSPAAPFPGTGGFQVDEIPATDMGDVTLQSPSPIQKMADRLRQRVTGMQRASAFRQAEQGAATQREAEMGLLARDAMRERETPSLQATAERIRNRMPDLLGRRAEQAREREEAAAPEAPATEGISVDEAFPAPGNTAMADALRGAGAVPATGRESAAEPAEIRPKSGKPYKTEGSARNIINIRKLEGYAPVEVDGGWVLRKGDVSNVAPQVSNQPENVSNQETASRVDSQIPASAPTSTPAEEPPAPDLGAEPQDAGQQEGPLSEAEKSAKSRRHFDDFKSWARGRYGRADYQRMLETGELNDIWNKVRGKTDAETVRGDQGQVPGEGREGEGLQDQGREGGEQPTPEGRQTTDAGAQEEAAVAFAPTHELPDGTLVRAVEGESGVFVDADGQEYEEPNATEVTDAQQVQAAETPAAAPAAEEGVTKKEKGRSTRLGLNADAEEVFEDENGVRYVVKNGIRISQKVAMRPTRAGVERVPVDDPRFDVAMKLKTITVNRREGTVSEQSDKTTEPTIDAAANEAATSPTNDMPQPTEGQKSAGNYKVGRVNLHGLEISIENPKGSKRTGTDKDGETWSQTMRHHYGYIRSIKPSSRKQGPTQAGIAATNILGNAPDAFPGSNHRVDLIPVIGDLVSRIREVNPALGENLPDDRGINREQATNLLTTDTLRDKIDSFLDIPSGVSRDRVDTILNQAIADGISAYAHLFGNLKNAGAILSEGYDSLDVQRKFMVKRDMRSAIKDRKVFESVVRLIPIDVVNMLARQQLASSSILNNQSMLLDALSSASLDDTVKVGRLADAIASSLPPALALRVAEKVTAIGKPGGASVQVGPAIGAADSRHTGKSEIPVSGYHSTEGADGDHVDIFIGPEAQREQPKVFVVDQIDPTTGAFDEHKVMFGFLNEAAARQGYLSNYQKGWKGVGAITPMSLDEFKAWVFDKAKTKKPAGRIERRKDTARRKRVAQMTEEEMRRELLTDELTGLGNRRAYNEDLESEVGAEFHAYMDVDALKWVNDNMGHANGDELLKMMGEAIRQGVDTTSEDGFVRGYHLSGDEFVILAQSTGMAERAAQLAQQAGQSAVLEYTAPDGTKITKTGVEFSYGIAQDLKAADEALQRNKTEREAAGLRPARGAVPAGVVTQPAEGGQAEVQGVEEPIAVKQPGKHLAVSKRFTGILEKELQAAGVDSTHDDITIHFRDPKYSAKTGGYHPVEVAIQPDGTLRYITDYTYAGPDNELVKEIDFDFESKVFGHNPGFGDPRDRPLVTGRGLYKTWQSNFSNYYDMGVFEVEVRSDKLREQGGRPAGIGEIPGTTVAVEQTPRVPQGFKLVNYGTSVPEGAGYNPGGIHTGEATAVVQRDNPYKVERGFGKTVQEAIDSAVARMRPVSDKQTKRQATVVDNSEVREGEYLVRDDGGYNLARFRIGAHGQAVKIEHHYEAQSTRAFAKEAIDKFIADRKATQAPKKPKDYGKSNKVFTEDAAAKARELLKKKLGQLNSGIDPEILQAGLTLAGYHIEAGARAFADYAKAMVSDLGEGVRPYLRSWYESVRHYPGFDNDGMTPISEMDAAVSDLATMNQEVTVNDDQRILDDVPRGDADAGAGNVQGTDAQRQNAGARAPEGAGGEPNADGNASGRAAGGRKRVSGGRRAGTGGDARVSAGEPRNHVIEAGGLREDRGWAQKARDNIRAIEIIRELEAEGRHATTEEQQALSLYVGWGGMSQAFPDQSGQFGKGFEQIGPRIRDLLTDREYETARRSIQYAHYTSEPIIRAMWKMAERMGFKGGKVFEPGMGIGHFAGIMPAEVAAHTEYNGLELDHTTAKIARALYPKWGVRQDDFTKAPLPADTYDLVIGNPPFADIAVKSDPKYAKHGFLLHDYFFAKSLDAVRPGGLLIFITSAGTMNKLDSKAREYLAERADLVGAIRLPSDAFKQNAGTEVTTDIIILRKKESSPDAAVAEGLVGPGDWVETTTVTLPDKNGEDRQGNVSRYFVAHPNMVLGIEGFTDKLYQGRYAVQPNGTPLNVQLAQAINALPEGVMTEWRDGHSHDAVDFAATEKKDGSYYLGRNGELMQYSEGVGRPVDTRGKGVTGGKTKAEIERIRGLIPVRDALRAVYSFDLNGDTEGAAKARATLNREYDAFVKKFGPINLANISYRRPTRIQAESARNEAREEARYAGQRFDEGSFDPRRMIADGNSLAAISKARMEARERALAAGESWSEGSFDPDEIPDIVVDKRPNIDPFMDDPESYRLRSIEHYDESTGEAEKGIVFERNVLALEKEPEIKSAGDALFHVLDRIGYPDIDAIADAAGLSVSQTLEELGDALFEVPGKPGVYETRDDYLSGNVRDKLRVARDAAAKDARYRRNVEALELAQPPDLPPSLITANLGMPWIPESVYEQFATEELGLTEFSASFQPKLGEWMVSGDSTSAAAVSTYGTPRMPAPKILYHAMNRITPKIFDVWRDADGEHRELNKEATSAAVDKVAEVKTKFADWIYGDQARADRLADLYNQRFNSLLPWSGDGSYMTTPGVAANWRWRPHQTRVMARILRKGNTYMGHAVGAGKTSAMIGAGMEMRRLGLVRKPTYVVPNHMLAQFTKEFYEQYPTARIMVADERRFHTDRRKQFIADVANQDLDAVIITHSAFSRIPVSTEFQDQIIQEQIDSYREIQDGLGDKQWDEDSEKRVTRKRVEKAIERLEQRLSSKIKGGAKDQVFTFEEMGVDFLFVDEAHMYRKLDFATRMSGVKGISPEGSQAAMDLYTKIRYLRTQNPARHIVMASGTAITNTMAELYSVSRYMQEDTLADMGLEAFDAWAAAYGDTVTELEQDAAGGYKPQTRFAQFVNVPELSAMVRQVMDVVTSKDLEQYVTRPSIKGGQRQLKMSEKSDALDEYQKELASRMEAIERRKGPPKKGDDILLSVINDGRHAAIDMRFVDPNIGRTDPPSKLDMLIDDVFDTWKATELQPLHRPESSGYSKDPVDHGPATQMVFANLGVGEGRQFNTYRYIVSELTRRGVPRDQVAIISDYKTHVARQRLFNDMNEGKVRILIGSTQKMATGVNAQRRLYAINNLDPLWYPADDEQRIGRGLRQGNMNPEIEIRDYSTKGTYDSQMWNLMEKKARFIEGFFRGDPSMRNMEDLGESSQYAQAKAMTTNDPRLIELTDLRQKIEKEMRRRSAFDTETYNARRRIREAEDTIETREDKIELLKRWIDRRQDITGDKFKGEVDGETFTDRQEFGKALWNARRKGTEAKKTFKRKVIGNIAGFELTLTVDKYKTMDGDQYESDLFIDFDDGHFSRLYGKSALELTEDVESNLTFERGIANAEYQIQRAEKDVQDFTPRLSKAYESDVDMDAMTQRVRDIEDELKSESQAAEATAEEVPQDDGAEFSRSAAPDAPTPLGLDAVKEIADRIVGSGGLSGGVRVHTVATEADLPADIQAQAAKEGATGQVVAVHQGRDIYLVADRHTSAAQVEESILHEGSHYGAQQLLGGDKQKAYRKLWFTLGGVKGLRELGAKLGFKMDSYIDTAADLLQKGQMTTDQRATYLVDEFLAHAQGQKAYESLPAKAARAIREFWGAIKAMLRSGGFAELPNYTESDLAYLLRNIHKAARGRPVSVTGMRQAMFMRADQSEITPTRDPENPDIRFSRTIAENAEAIREASTQTLKEKGGALWDSLKEATAGPLGYLPNVQDYLKRRYLTLGRIAEIDEGAKAIYDAFANAGDDIPAVYEFLTSREATENAIKSRTVRDKAVEVKAVLEDIGQQLVDRGLLSEEAFENNRGQYLPRIYLKHLLRDQDIALIGTGKKPSDLGYLKQRKDIPEEIRRLILGEITDPGYLASKGFGQQSRDIALLDWMAEIAENRDWVWQQSVVEWAPGGSSAKAERLAEQIADVKAEIKDIKAEVQDLIYGNVTTEGRTRINKLNQLVDAKRAEIAGLRREMRKAGAGPRKVTPFWLMAEAERLRAQSHYLDVDDAAASRTLADRMEEAGRSAMDAMDADKIPDDFKQMPNSPRYGALRGLIVRKEIYNDVVGTLRITTGDESFAERILGHGGLATKATQLWKWSKVAANPPAQIRNFVSNGVLLHLSGVPFHKVPLRVIQAVKQIRAKAQGRPASEWKHYDVARRYGVTESTFSAQELLRMERDLLALEARNANKISLATLKHLAGIVMDKTGDWYQFAEALFKTAKIIDAMERQNLSEGDAAIEAQKWLFDYSLVGPSTRYLRNAPVGMPFLTFQLKALPRMLEVARTAPWRFLPYVALPYVLTSLVAGMADVDDDDVKALQKALPEWLQSRGHAYVLPVKDDDGRWQAMDFGYFLPWTMWTSLVTETSKGELGDAMMTSGLLGGPLPDMIAAIQTNRDPFTGRDIINEADPPATQAMSMLTYLWSMAMPTWLTNYGAGGHLWRALEGEVDRQGLPKTTVGQAGLRMFGVNLYPIDPEVSRAQNLRHMRFEISEINRRMRQQLRSPSLTADDRQEIRDEYMALIKRRMEQMAKYAAESKVHPNLRRAQ